MAKIKPAGSTKKITGPKNPGAVGCIILLGMIAVVVGVVLFLSFMR